MNATIGMELVLEGESGTDAEELDSLARRLRDRLLELDVADVRLARAAGPVPDGAKPGELIVAGGLAVTLSPVLVRAVVNLVETWLRNRPLRSVKVAVGDRTIEVGHASREEQRRLVDAFVTAAAAAPADGPGDGPAPDPGTPDPGPGDQGQADPGRTAPGHADPGAGDGGDGR
jgi:hypothetical protein